MPILWIPGLLLLQAEPSAAPGDGDPFALMAVGLGVVFLSLALIGVALALLSKFSARFEGPVEIEEAGGELYAASGTDDAGIDTRTVALLTAAAFATVGRPIRVQRIKLLNQNKNSAWAGAGRTSVQSSHNIRRSL